MAEEVVRANGGHVETCRKGIVHKASSRDRAWNCTRQHGVVRALYGAAHRGIAHGATTVVVNPNPHLLLGGEQTTYIHRFNVPSNGQIRPVFNTDVVHRKVLMGGIGGATVIRLAINPKFDTGLAS
jgi:hypothetical protein